MTKYFKMESDNYLDFGVTKSPRLGQSILGGRNIEQDILPHLVYEVDFPDSIELPHFLTGRTVLARQKLIDLLKSQVDNFQAFPAVILNPERGKKRSGFYLFNVHGMLKIVNLEESGYDELMSASSDGLHAPLVAFNKIAINSHKTMGMLMFELAEDPTALLIHESTVNALSDNRPENGWGIDVIEVESV